MHSKDKKEMLVADIIVNNGHDFAHVIRESEPGGREADYVTHAIVTTGRMVERLYRKGILNDRYDDARGPLRQQAAKQLRDDFERGGFCVGALAAQDTTRPYVSGGRTDALSIGSDDSAEDYERAMRQLGRDWRPVIRFVVIEDGHPMAYGQKTRSDGIIMLITGLDKLVTHYGLDSRR